MPDQEAPGPESAPQKPPVIIVIAADKGGVGKTTVARSLLDYLARYGVPTRPFDTEPAAAPVLGRFHPEAESLAAETVPGQMKLVEAATTSAVTVVDCRAGLLSLIIKAFGRVRLLDDVKAGRLRLVILHVVGANVASQREVAAVAAGLDGADVIQVNVMANRDAVFPPPQPRQRVVTLGNLEEEAYEAADDAGVPFSKFADAPKYAAAYGLIRTRLVRAWLDDAFRTYDEAGILGLVRA